MDIKAKIGVIITDENNEKILLIKERGEENNPLSWNVIKGTYGDSDDKNVFDAAVRECEEEVSVKVELVSALRIYISQTPEKIRIQFNFLAKIKEGVPNVPDKEKQASRKEYIEELRWFGKEELAGMRPGAFLSNRAYQLVQDWLNGKKYPLEIYKQVEL